MNIIDKIISLFSPSAGLRRQQARIQSEILSQRFNDSSKLSRITGNFMGEREGGDLNHARVRILQDKATSLYRRNPYANGAIETITSRIVGKGFECESLAQLPDGSSFDDFRLEAQRVWKLWDQNCHASGKPGEGGLSFKELQHLAVKEVAKCGEVLIHKIYLPSDSGEEIPFRIELIEAQRLADDLLTRRTVETGNTIYDGIEFNQSGQRVAYHVYKDNPNNPMTFGNQEIIRIPASEIIHLFKKDSVSQNRGITWLAPVLDTLHNMGDLIFDELTASKIGACTVGVVENSSPFNSTMPVAVNAGNEESDSEYTKMYPGQILNLRPGQKFEGFSPNRPNLDVNEFVQNLLRGVAAGVPGIKASEVHMDFTESSFSAEKAAENSAFPKIQFLQEWFINQCLKPIYREVMKTALLAGAFDGVQIGDAGTLDDYFYANKLNLTEANFRGPGTRSINPVDDQNALILSKQNGTISLQETSAMEGVDWREIVRNSKQVYEYAIGLGCPPLVAERLAYGNTIAPIQANQNEKPK